MLLAGQEHDWFWVGIGGSRLKERAIEGMLRRQSERRFGEAFGSHRFRHAAGTIAPMADPKRPAAVAAMLGNSKGVAEKAYNMGRQQEACREYQNSFRKERRRLEGIALRAFGRSNRATKPAWQVSQTAMMVRSSRRVYLAGPEVFLSNAREIGARKRAICERHGLVGVFPADEEDAFDPALSLRRAEAWPSAAPWNASCRAATP